MKENRNFQNLIDREKYQVFILSSPALFPFTFARHPWFVVNTKGKITRWEVVHRKDCCPGKSFGHIHTNALSPFQAIGFFSFASRNSAKAFWKAKLVTQIEGEEGSTAQKIAEFIEKSKDSYPYKDKYHLRGPNSNTYIQWVLDNFPEWDVKLSWNFVGKNYKE